VVAVLVEGVRNWEEELWGLLSTMRTLIKGARS